MNESFVMRRALENDKLLGFFFAYDFVHKSMFVSYASAPASAHVPKRLWLANADVPIAFYVLDKQIYSLEDFLVLQLPTGIFIPGARRKVDVHGIALRQSSMSSWRFASPRSYDSIDSRRMRWFVSDQKGSGFSDTTSNGSRRRITDCRRNRRTALDMSRPARANNLSASFRSSESTRICNVDVAILNSFVVQTHYNISRFSLKSNG